MWDTALAGAGCPVFQPLISYCKRKAAYTKSLEKISGTELKKGGGGGGEEERNKEKKLDRKEEVEEEERVKGGKGKEGGKNKRRE